MNQIAAQERFHFDSVAVARFCTTTLGATVLELGFVDSWLDETALMGRLVTALASRVRRAHSHIDAAIARAQAAQGSASAALASAAAASTSSTSTAVEASTAAELAAEHKVPIHYQPPTTISFLSSRYAVSLFLLAILVNRVQHVVPPRRLFELRAWARVAIRVPSIALLIDAMILVASQMPSLVSVIPERLAETRLSVDDIMWRVFLALTITCVSETFVRALDNDRFRNPPFNLLSLAFMIHWHSVSPPEMKPTEPVFALVLLTIGETLSLVLVDASGLRWRLAVTGIYSLVGQAAMCKLLLTDFEGKDRNMLPILQYCNRFPELLFQVIATFTIACSVLAQLITERKITFERTFGHSSTLPGPTDDFATSIIRYGSACLETSTLHGLGNELASVSTSPYVEIGRGIAGPVTVPPSSHLPPVLHGSGIGGLNREIRDIRAKVDRPDTSDSLSRSTSVSREAWVFTSALCKLSWLLWRDAIREMGFVLRLGGPATRPGRLGRFLRFVGVQPAGAQRPRGVLRRLFGTKSKGRTRGVASTSQALALIDDDPDDADFAPGSDDDDSRSDSSSATDDEVDQPPAEDEPGPLVLYGDLERDPDHGAPSLDLMLAHLHSDVGSPLTRRRYATDMATALSDTIAARRTAQSPRRTAPSTDEPPEPALCVVCRVEQRSIIFWPCRAFDLLPLAC